MRVVLLFRVKRCACDTSDFAVRVGCKAAGGRKCRASAADHCTLREHCSNMNDVPGGASRRFGAVEVNRPRGLSVDQGHEVSRLLQEASTPGQCGSCLLIQRIAGHPSVPASSHVDSVEEYVDEDVVVISLPGVSGLVVLPRRHVCNLGELPTPSRANVLAALRRATQSVNQDSPGSTARVDVVSATSAADEHMCLHVTPVEAESAGHSSRAG